MKLEASFLMPDYYPQFSCKMGSCRSACCEGWPISLSIADYFKLLGADCSEELRKKLDCGMHLLDHSIPEAYAQISPRYDGNCPMRLADGRCGIQAELGEDALAAVCRLYPRGIRVDGVLECSCANSCESVLELFLNKDAPISFLHRRQAVSLPEIQSIPDRLESVAREQDIRLWFISIMQERKYPLKVRLMRLGNALTRLEDALKSHDKIKIEQLRQLTDISAPAFRDRDMDAVQKAKELLVCIAEKSSLSKYISVNIADYCLSKHNFEKLLPQWEVWFEHILVNHMFFTQFPFENPPVSLHDKFLALSSVYVLMRYLCLGINASAVDNIVDVVATIFRLVDHTDFDRYAAQILKRLDCESIGSICKIICL